MKSQDICSTAQVGAGRGKYKIAHVGGLPPEQDPLMTTRNWPFIPNKCCGHEILHDCSHDHDFMTST